MTQSSNINPKTDLYTYSIATMVTRRDEYDAMLQTFNAAGFVDDCECLMIDNSESNQQDAYQAIQYFLTEAQGKYLIICHQDVRLNHDTRNELDKALTELDSIDPKWAVAGNAGGASNFNQIFQRISDPHGVDQKLGPLPSRVSSLDENFLILKRSTGVSTSKELSGFHLYGTDLCLNAERLGYHCYVINFHLTHLSGGNPNSIAFKVARNAFIRHHSYQMQHVRLIKTTCTRIVLTPSKLCSKLLNMRWMLGLIARLQRLR